MSTPESHLLVRLPREQCDSLEFLAAHTGKNVSELVSNAINQIYFVQSTEGKEFGKKAGNTIIPSAVGQHI